MDSLVARCFMYRRLQSRRPDISAEAARKRAERFHWFVGGVASSKIRLPDHETMTRDEYINFYGDL